MPVAKINTSLVYGFIDVTNPEGNSLGRALVNNGRAHVKKPVLDVAIISGDKILDAMSKRTVLGTFGNGDVRPSGQSKPVATYKDGQVWSKGKEIARYTPADDERGGAVAAILTDLIPFKKSK